MRLRIGLACLIGVLGACSSEAPADEKPQVAAAFYPLAFLAEEIGGEHIRVVDLTPPGVEPHDLELSSSQVIDLERADLVVYIGAGFQPAVEAALTGAGGELLDVLGDGDSDPHAWLAPSEFGALAEMIGDALSGIDPAHASAYSAQVQIVRARSNELDEAFGRGLANCRSRMLVTSHEAFGRLAQAYDLEQVGILGIDPEGEPSPQQLAEIARLVKERDVTTIFTEELLSARAAETIAAETGATTAVLGTLETQPADGNYFDVMEANLDTLRRGLDCEQAA